MAFSKSQMPFYGLVEGSQHLDGSYGLRHYIWKIAGYIENEKCLNGYHNFMHLQTKHKK